MSDLLTAPPTVSYAPPREHRPPRAGGMLDGPASDESLLDWVLRPWRRYLLFPVLLAVTVAGLTLLVPNKYRSAAQFYPEQRMPNGAAGLGALAGIAGQLGVGLPGSGQGPQFYAQVLGSRSIVEDVLAGKVRPEGARDSVTLVEFLAEESEATPKRYETAVRELRSATATTVNPRTNIIELAVTVRDREVAAQIVRRYLAALDRFNRDARQTQAGRRRRFVEAQLREAQDSLLRAESLERNFLQGNRVYRDSPGLAYEYERLHRATSNYQALYGTLRRDYDTARLDEINDAAVITTVDPPRPPLRKDSPHRALLAIGAGFLGLLLSLLWASLRAFLGRMKREQPEAFAALVARFGRRVPRHAAPA